MSLFLVELYLYDDIGRRGKRDQFDGHVEVDLLGARLAQDLHGDARVAQVADGPFQFLLQRAEDDDQPLGVAQRLRVQLRRVGLRPGKWKQTTV